MIKAAELSDREMVAKIIRGSFRDVASRFSLTKENCPKHPSNCISSWIESDIKRGVQYFLLYKANNPIGCVGLESPSPDVCYLERLSVLPEMRGKHFGIKLVQHALEWSTCKGADRVSIGIIAEQSELKEWYEELGFIEIQTKSFPHLPFKVCLMEYAVKGFPTSASERNQRGLEY
jgi:N-acetylglutamate synthase-like GNAT family acetyltransferase